MKMSNCSEQISLFAITFLEKLIFQKKWIHIYFTSAQIKGHPPAHILPSASHPHLWHASARGLSEAASVEHPLQLSQKTSGLWHAVMSPASSSHPGGEVETLEMQKIQSNTMYCKSTHINTFPCEDSPKSLDPKAELKKQRHFHSANGMFVVDFFVKMVWGMGYSSRRVGQTAEQEEAEPVLSAEAGQTMCRFLCWSLLAPLMLSRLVALLFLFLKILKFYIWGGQNVRRGMCGMRSVLTVWKLADLETATAGQSRPDVLVVS